MIINSKDRFIEMLDWELDSAGYLGELGEKLGDLHKEAGKKESDDEDKYIKILNELIANYIFDRFVSLKVSQDQQIYGVDEQEIEHHIMDAMDCKISM